MVEGLKFIRSVAKSEPFAKYVAEEQLPGPDVQTDEQLNGAYPYFLTTP